MSRHAFVAAYAFAAALLIGASAHAQSMPPGFAALRAIDPSIRQDMRYASANNFTGHPLPGYGAAECWLERAAALALHRVQTDLRKQGYSLKVYDCYRPARAVHAMARWAADPHPRPDTSRFYPGANKARLFSLGYIAAHSAHSRGVAIDLTIVPLNARPEARFSPSVHYGSCAGPASARAPDDSLEMGTGFDCFDAKSRTRAPNITAEERANRDRLIRAMTRHGFHNYFREWWHFTYPAADPRLEYDFPIR